MKTQTMAALFGAALVATPVAASDIPRDIYANSWAGPYVGAHAGGSWGDASASFGGVSGSADYDGGQFGVQGGYNWQGNGWVFGVEGDFSFTGNDYMVVGGLGSATSELQWLATVRARVGRDMGRWMPYVTAGVAFADNEITITSGGTASDSNIHTGIAVGGGAEFAFSDGWSAKAEYLFVDLGDEAYFATLFPPGLTAEAELHVLRAGINRHW